MGPNGMCSVLVIAVLGVIPAAGQEPEAWRALPIPSLCADGAPGAGVPRLPRLDLGQHLIFATNNEAEPEELLPRPVLPLPALLELLSEDARRRGNALRFASGAPPLLVHGQAASIEAMSSLLAELETAGEALFVDLEVWVTAGASGAGTHPNAAAVQAATRGAAPWARARARSGETLALGARTLTSFVASYTVEVAQDAGIAAPLVGQALTGETLHVRACRVRGGRELHIEGLFDRTEMLAKNLFDTQSPDLGRIERPVLGVAQVAFAGVVPSGGVLSIEVDAGAAQGATVEAKGFTVWIRATTRPDATLATWRVLDVALLETPARELPAPEPGAGLGGLLRRRGRPTAALEPLPAASLAQLAESGPRGTGGSGGTVRGRPLVVWAPGLLLAPLEEQATWASIDQLMAAAEGVRLTSRSMSVTQGDLTARLPVTAGVPARLMIGSESTVLAEYDLQIAPESWMPVPRVERTFDGLVLEACLRDDALALDAWIAATSALGELSRKDTGIGDLQLPQRSFHSGSAAISRSAQAPGAVEVLPRTAGASALSVETAQP